MQTPQRPPTPPLSPTPLATPSSPARRPPVAPLVRWAGWLIGVGGVLFGGLKVGVNLATDAQSPLSAQFSPVFHQVGEGVQMVALMLLSIGLIGLYLRPGRSSRVRTAAFVLALVGTELAIALLWSDTVLLAELATTTPRTVDAFMTAPSARVLIGLLGSNVVFALGWVVFALSQLRVSEGWRVAWVVLIAGLLAFPLLPPLGGGLVAMAFAGVAWSSRTPADAASPPAT